MPSARRNNGDEEITSGIARPLVTAVTSAFLATSLLFSSPLLPTPDALATVAAANTRPLATETATSIDIDLSSLPALTRKAIVNREKLTNYLIESIKSFKPILDLLSDSDAVTVTPPKDVKGAINQALTKGDAQFLVNGESVDVRVESVPGVIVIRVINPHIPRLPFLRDGTAAIQFVDNIVDAAPEQLEKAAEEVESIGKFLSWGAPQQAPIQYSGSSLDNLLSSKFMFNGNTISLGSFGDLTNSEVALLVLGAGIGGAYATSYAYYVSLNEKAERDANEKKEKKANEAAAKKKEKAETDAKKAKAEAPASAAVDTEKPVQAESKVDDVDSSAGEKVADKEEVVVDVPTSDEGFSTPSDNAQEESGKKRNIVKKIFRRDK
jgi:hypothetical protein